MLAAVVLAASACATEADLTGAEPSGELPESATSTEVVTSDPVVIVAGTFSPEFANVPLEARLRADGYDAHIFALPGGGTADIAETSALLADFVDEVLEQSDTQRVDLVGHSQGGLVARYFVKELGGDENVDSLITLGTPNYGTESAEAARSGEISDECESCSQMATGSPFLESLNEGDDTVGDVAYTNIYSSFDMVIRPVESSELRDGATNLLIQDQCRFRLVGHIGLIFDGTVYGAIVDSLEHRPVELSCWSI